MPTGIEIQVQRMYRFESDRPLKAFADIIVNDCILIKGIKVLNGNDGLFVTMPQEQAQDKKWYDSVRCLTQEVREQITHEVLSVYNEDNTTIYKQEPSKGIVLEDLPDDYRN